MGVGAPPRAPARRGARGERVLDLGCGAGRFVAALRDAGADPVGVELAEARARARAPQRPGRGAARARPDGAIPLEDASVDLVWCSEVLEHVPDTAGLLSEARRVLRTGGRLLVTTPSHDLPRRALIALAALGRALRPARPARALLQPPLAGAGARDVRVRGRPRDAASAGRRGCVRRWSRAPARPASSSSSALGLERARGLEVVRRPAVRGRVEVEREPERLDRARPGHRAPRAGSARAAATSRRWRAGAASRPRARAWRPACRRARRRCTRAGTAGRPTAGCSSAARRAFLSAASYLPS